MVLPGTAEAWNGWIDCADPQDFMDRSCARGSGPLLMRHIPQCHTPCQVQLTILT